MEPLRRRTLGLTAMAKLRIEQLSERYEIVTDPAKMRYMKALHQKMLERAFFLQQPIGAVLSTSGSAASYQHNRTVLRHVELEELIDCVTAIERAGMCANRCEAFLDRLGRSLMRLAEVERAVPTLKVPAERKAMQRLLSAPANWQQLMVAHAPTASLKAALLILQLTGCRVGEIEAGVRFECREQPGDPRLSLRFLGLKVRWQGEQQRHLVRFADEDQRPEIEQLIDILQSLGVSASDLLLAPKNLGDKVRRVSRILWPEHSSPPSAHTFRYAYRRMVAAEGFSSEQIAIELGQRSIHAQRWYGSASHASDGTDSRWQIQGRDVSLPPGQRARERAFEIELLHDYDTDTDADLSDDRDFERESVQDQDERSNRAWSARQERSPSLDGDWDS